MAYTVRQTNDSLLNHRENGTAAKFRSAHIDDRFASKCRDSLLRAYAPYVEPAAYRCILQFLSSSSNACLAHDGYVTRVSRVIGSPRDFAFMRDRNLT